MQNLIATNAVTMSSLEIAELVNFRHNNVKRTIRTLAEKGVIRSAQIEFSERINNLGFNVKQEYYLFTGEQGKRDSIIVVAQLSPEFTARLVDRWQELEEQLNKPIIPQTLPEALRLAADLAEENQLLIAANQEQTQKIESLESLFKHGQSVPQFCKKLNGVNVMQVCSFLEGKNWLYNESKSGVRWRVKSYARDKYMTEEVDEIALHGQEPFIINKPVLLKNGAVKLYEFYLKGELPMKKTWNGEYTQDKELKVAV